MIKVRFLKAGLMVVVGTYALVFWEKTGFFLQLGATSFSSFCGPVLPVMALVGVSFSMILLS